MQGQVTVEMQADAGRIFDLVSDVARIGEYSPETFEAEWLGGASGPAVGARFRGHVKRNGRGPVYWTECRVTECEPGHRFAFDVLVGGRPVNTWSYTLRPTGAGTTEVTESFRLASNPFNRLYWALAGWARGRTNERGMRATLERIRSQVESQGGLSGP